MEDKGEKKDESEDEHPFSGENPLDEQAQVIGGGLGDPEAEFQKWMESFYQGKLDKTLRSAQTEVLALKQDHSNNSKTMAWVENLLGDLITEKSKMNDHAKKINLSIRQRELEFRNSQALLQEELKSKEDQLTKKEAALTRTKEQLSQASKVIDKLKAALETTSDRGHYKQKYEFAQKILASTKDENAALVEKLETLKKQLGVVQVSTSSGGVSPSEYAELQAKYEKVHRQAEEFKKAYRQLSSHFTEWKKSRPSQGDSRSEELKRRLSAAMQLITESKKETDQFKSQLTASQSESHQLRNEIAKLQHELKEITRSYLNSQMNSGGSSGDDTGSSGL